jgi:hypothetical protein
LVVYGVSVAVGVELLQSYIYANHTSGIPTQQGIHAHFHAKGDIVFPRCGTGYGGIQNLAAKTSGKLGFHFPNFRKLDFVSNDTDSFGLVPRAVGLATDMLGFETGIVRPFLEEILVGPFEVLQGFLQRHAVRLVQPHIFLPALQFRQQGTGLGICDRCPVFCPLVTTQGKKMVVHESATA